MWTYSQKERFEQPLRMYVNSSQKSSIDLSFTDLRICCHLKLRKDDKEF